MNSHKTLIHDLYWKKDYNCAMVTLTVLSKEFNIELNNQIIPAVKGIPGGAKQGSLCGLNTGALIFIGILETIYDIDVKQTCIKFSEEFVKQFGSVDCSVLRPEGFKPDNPPHLCEELTIKTVNFTIEFIRKNLLPS